MSVSSLPISTRGTAFTGALWTPENSSDAAILLLPDFNGADATMQRIATRLEAAGYSVLLPDLFAPGLVPAPPEDADDAARADWATTISDSDVVSYARASMDALVAAVPNARYGIVGFGWGGAFALMTAAQDMRVSAIADICGEISYPVLTAKRPGSPLNFVAGIESAFFGAFALSDPLFPVAEVERLRVRLEDHDKIAEIKHYEGAPTRFWRDDSLPQTVAFWRRLEAWLHSKLREDATPPPMPQIVTEGGYRNEESRIHA
ncbi:MAG TPA: dienelactone hydrolase family protein [Abditibacteriaceae bacterium]|jgi:dienelactone hydrolase